MQSILLSGGTVVELHPLRIQERDLLIQSGQIADLASTPKDAQTIDCRGCLIFAGLVVAHTHAYSALAAGMPVPPEPAQTFKEILEKVWWRLDSALDEGSLRASARIAAIDAVKNGATCVIDHHESPGFIDGSLDIICEAFEEVGLRSVLTYGATDRHGEAQAKAGLRESERYLAKASGLSRGMIGLHAPFTCSDRTLEQAAGLAKDHEAWLHYHAAEGPDDQVAAQARWKTPLFTHLQALGLVNERTLLAHCVQMQAAEIESIKGSRAWVTHQARSNMNNGVGYAEALSQLDRVALGTDGIDDDVLSELKTAFFRRRDHAGPSVWPDPVQALSQGQALVTEVFETPLASLAQGTQADLSILAYDPPTPLTEGSLGAHLLFGMSSRDVRDVFVAGRRILDDGKVVGLDEAVVRADARIQAAALFGRMS